MKKLFAAAAFAALTLLASASPSAAGTFIGDSFMNTQSFQFVRSGVNVDSTTLVGVDSVRTTGINTNAWDWSFLVGSSAASYAPHAIATVTFWTPVASAVIGDTIYFVIERGHPVSGGVTYSVDGRSVANIGVGAVGNCAVLNHVSGTVAEWVGLLQVDLDTIGANNLYGVTDFRFKLFSDTVGATCAQGSIFGYVSAPKPRVSN